MHGSVVEEESSLRAETFILILIIIVPWLKNDRLRRRTYLRAAATRPTTPTQRRPNDPTTHALLLLRSFAKFKRAVALIRWGSLVGKAFH